MNVLVHNYKWLNRKSYAGSAKVRVHDGEIFSDSLLSYNRSDRRWLRWRETFMVGGGMNEFK